MFTVQYISGPANLTMYRHFRTAFEQHDASTPLTWKSSGLNRLSSMLGVATFLNVLERSPDSYRYLSTQPWTAPAIVYCQALTLVCGSFADNIVGICP